MCLLAYQEGRSEGKFTATPNLVSSQQWLDSPLAMEQ